MERLGSWLAASRPARALLAPLAVAVGVSYAHFDAQPGHGPWSVLAVTAGAFAAGLGVNLLEHAWDLAEPAREATIAGAGALVLAVLCGLALAPLSGPAAFGYGAAATALAMARRVPTVGLDTLGWGLGDVATVLAWGPFATLAGFASQAGTGSSGAFFAGVPVGLVAAAVTFARHFTNRDADARYERVTPVVALGEDRARLGLVVLPLLAAAAVVVAVRLGEYAPWAALAAAPLALAAVTAWRLPVGAQEAAYARWERLALSCAIPALLCIVAAAWLASPA